MSVKAGYAHGYAIKSDGTVWGIGNNSFGQIGGSGNTNIWRQIGTDSNWISIFGGGDSIYGLKK